MMTLSQFKKQFAIELKEQRLALDMTQPEFAKLVGVTKMTIWWWENGKRLPSAFLFWQMQGVFNLIKQKPYD